MKLRFLCIMCWRLLQYFYHFPFQRPRESHFLLVGSFLKHTKEAFFHPRHFHRCNFPKPFKKVIAFARGGGIMNRKIQEKRHLFTRVVMCFQFQTFLQLHLVYPIKSDINIFLHQGRLVILIIISQGTLNCWWKFKLEDSIYQLLPFLYLYFLELELLDALKHRVDSLNLH